MVRQDVTAQRTAPPVSDGILDSLCANFVGDSIGHHFEATDVRVVHTDCFDRLEHPTEYPNPWSNLGMIVLQVSNPCTVSVILTDSAGTPIAWKHYLQLPPPADHVNSAYHLFPNTNAGVYRYNVLINGQLVSACPIHMDHWNSPRADSMNIDDRRGTPR